MNAECSASICRTGRVAALVTAGLSGGYVLALIIGLMRLERPDEPVGDPWFIVLEVLILAIILPIVVLFSAVHALVGADERAWTASALVCAGAAACLTSVSHFCVLTLSRNPAFLDPALRDSLFAFHWPSLSYAIDIAAWDFFFALACLLLAAGFGRERAARPVRLGLRLSGVLSLAGLAGPLVGNMQVRNIGILGYAVCFPLTTLLIAGYFARREGRLDGSQ